MLTAEQRKLLNCQWERNPEEKRYRMVLFFQSDEIHESGYPYIYVVGHLDTGPNTYERKVIGKSDSVRFGEPFNMVLRNTHIDVTPGGVFRIMSYDGGHFRAYGDTEGIFIENSED